MKSLYIKSFFTLSLLFSLNAFAQEPTDTVLLVNGVCEMCQNTIQNAALKTKGVKHAVWNVQTKVLSLSYEANKVSLEEISNNIAKSGYDTEYIAATEEDYKALHKCCHYRDPEVVNAH